MNQPLFKIGETVIRQAPDRAYPQYNGEYVILGILTYEEYSDFYLIVHDNPGRYYYELEGFNCVDEEDGQTRNHSSERFLFKKHPPATDEKGNIMSFTDVLNSCNIKLNKTNNVN